MEEEEKRRRLGQRRGWREKETRPGSQSDFDFVLINLFSKMLFSRGPSSVICTVYFFPSLS
jgi:hypothetical protein